MSSAKPTPRYVEAVPRNLRIVGPTEEAQVIPIRRITPAYVPAFDAPATAVPVPRRSKRRAVPVAHRPWRVLLVSQMPGGATRSFAVSRWQARVAVIGLCLLLVAGGGAVAALVTAIESPDLFATSADAALLRAQLLDSADSLALVRTELLSAREAASDSAIAAAVARLADAAAKPIVKPPARPRLLARTPRVAARDRIILAPRNMADLPVIGVISSTFSRSRRHPILHLSRPHLGVDIAAARGTHIVAPAPGRVTFVGHKFGFGLVVEVQHSSVVKTRYAHMRAAMVKVGDELARGDQIGTVGTSGITTGPHLHYEILVNGRQVDPLHYVLPQPASANAPATVAAPDAPAADGAPAAVPGGAAPPDDASAARPTEQDSTPHQAIEATPR